MKIILTIILAISLIFTGCSDKDKEKIDNTVKDVKESTVDKVKEEIVKRFSESEQAEKMKEYFGMVEKRMSEDKILNFLDENLEKMSQKNIDDMVLDLERYLNAQGIDTKGVIEKIAPYVQYTSDEIKNYVRIWNNEVENPTTDGEMLNAPVDELLKRAIDMEKHLAKYPEGNTKETIEEIYISYTGMSIRGLGNPYIYAIDGEAKLKPEVRASYENVIKDYPDSALAQVLRQYLTELDKDDEMVNGINVEYFYDNFASITKNALNEKVYKK